VFAASHMHLPSVAPLFVFALGLGLSYELTGSLLVPITMHALFNAVMVIQLIFERTQP
jgi:membrane protease YdiL (CAAX protease family)